MVESGKQPESTNSSSHATEKFVFWDGDSKIVPHLMYEYFAKIGIGKYYVEIANWKNSEPLIVKVNGNIISEVNVAYLIETAKNYILKCTEESGESGPILDSFHRNTSLFGARNLKMLPTLKLEILKDTKGSGFFFFRNGVAEVSSTEIKIRKYDEFDGYVWENSIIDHDFSIVTPNDLEKKCNFMQFLHDLTVVDDKSGSAERFNSLQSAVGYLLHKFKDGNTNKAIILMDVFVDGQPNGGSGKSLLVTSIGKLRKLSLLDGKKFDPKEWFALSSVGLDTSVLLYDDVKKDFNFEHIFSQLTGGMEVRRKYKDHIRVPHEESPKVALTTNYAINGDSSSHRRRKFEFEVSATYSANFSPRDKFNKNFFDNWNKEEWNYFYNTMFQCLRYFLKNGLVESEPINIRYTKLVNNTCEEFIEFADSKVEKDKQMDKKLLYADFIKEYPEYKYDLKQRVFTLWLRAWGEYNKFIRTEGHSGSMSYILFTDSST